jgi:hydroxyacylglutathione hydrolase
VTRDDLARHLHRGDAPPVLAVRTGPEYRAGHIPGARHLPTTKIPFRRRLRPADKNVLLVLTCEHGPRAQLAAGVLKLLGYTRVELLEGHLGAWRRAGLPLEE